MINLLIINSSQIDILDKDCDKNILQECFNTY